jgi:putative ATP-binding cassette transporter
MVSNSHTAMNTTAMSTTRPPFRVTVSRLSHAVRVFAGSDFGWKAAAMFAALVASLAGANALNVVNSYVGRNFMTAIADRDRSEFARQALFYLAVFAASTVVAVLARFAEERLGVLWREFLTRRAVDLYLADGAYFRLEASGKLAHPDQRIAEDVRAFTVTTLSFVLMALNSSFTVVAFSGVLWSISPLLFIVAVLYAASGSYLTIVLGRPLIGLNSAQLDKEASFRADLIHVREHGESILIGHHEASHGARLMSQLDALVENFRRITNVNFRVGLFTTGYNWLIQIIPALIVAPAFMSGTIEFGVITQSAMAFSTLVAAFSLIVTQYQSLSNFAAVVGRLSALMETIEELKTTSETAVEIVQGDGRLAYERLTLMAPRGDRAVLKDLSISVPSRARVLVTGPNQDAGVALFKATAGCAIPGTGRIIRPINGQVFFLPQRPYLPSGALRQILAGNAPPGGASDEQLLQLLRAVDLERALSQAGDFDTERDWRATLSLAEQQLLALGRVLFAMPQLVFLDRLEAALAPDQEVKILRLLAERSIGYVTIGQRSDSADLAALYDAVLECMDDGDWTWRVLGAGIEAS